MRLNNGIYLSILVNFLCRIIVLTQKKLNLRLVNCDLPSISPFAK